MNPFEDISTNDNTSTKDSDIQIWVETTGRKKNTYVSGWNIPDDQLKEHLKTIKKKNGCNGTIKDVPNETGSELLKVLQLQGDHTDYITNYLILNGIEKDKIRIKG